MAVGLNASPPACSRQQLPWPKSERAGGHDRRPDRQQRAASTAVPMARRERRERLERRRRSSDVNRIADSNPTSRLNHGHDRALKHGALRAHQVISCPSARVGAWIPRLGGRLNRGRRAARVTRKLADRGVLAARKPSLKVDHTTGYTSNAVVTTASSTRVSRSCPSRSASSSLRTRSDRSCIPERDH
jgi:hypothetical protein